MLQGRRVLLCVTGGVAAYKSAYLARRLVEAGADVRVALTDSALEFVGPQTFAAITGQQPASSLFGEESVSPHTEMWEHVSTQRNMASLIGDGVHVVGPNTGPLAGGDSGIGRVAEPEEIVEAASAVLAGDGAGRTVLVTAGGTREPIDPVRFLGNRSSGKMGHAIADEALRRGYDVTLVTTSDISVHPAVKLVTVETADEMFAAVDGVDVNIAVMSAAVADFKPEQSHEAKIARNDGLDELTLVPTPDILASVVAREKSPFTVGFAAETGDIDRAIEKAQKKQVDMLVYNDVTEPGSGFGTDTNRVVFIWKDGSTEELPLLSKREVAVRLWDRIAAALDSDG
jgi:phosphopantothenoylcysteine decarboxylase/phosphopantothenate--cysteine ligase